MDTLEETDPFEDLAVASEKLAFILRCRDAGATEVGHHMGKTIAAMNTLLVEHYDRPPLVQI